MKSSSSGRPPSEAICSQAARRMSKPVTIAPRRFARGDRLQACDAGAQHEHLGRRHRAGGGGHHAEEAARLARGDQHRGVAPGGGLRGERVHRLRPRRPRDRLHREGGHAGGGERPVGLGGGPGREVADQELVRVELADLLGGRGGDAEDDLGAPGDVGVDELGARLRVLGVGVPGRVARAALDQHVDVLVLLQRLDDVRDERDPALPIDGLSGHSDLHLRRRTL